MKSSQVIPGWFNLDNYDVLNQLENSDFAFQLSERISLSQRKFPLSSEDLNLSKKFQEKIVVTLDDAFGEEEPIPSTYSTGNERQISSGPDLKDYSSFELTQSRSITPLSILMAKHQGRIARNLYPKDTDRNTDDIFEELCCSFDLVFGNTSIIPGPKPFNISIDLNTDDEAILKELKALLPIIREELNAPDPGISLNIALKKALNYRAIPYLDILIWSKQNGLKITDDTIAAALFPEGHRDAYFIRSTLKKFLQKVTASTYYKEPFF